MDARHPTGPDWRFGGQGSARAGMFRFVVLEAAWLCVCMDCMRSMYCMWSIRLSHKYCH